MKLMLIRHAEPDYAVDSLTEKGRREAELLSRRLARIPDISGIYVSPLGRAQDTAALMDKAVKEILDKFYQDAVEILKANREDMDKVVAYLLEKETITGAEMVAIIEGRDPELVEDAYASTRAREEGGFRPSQPEVIEPAAKKVHMISQKIEAPETTLEAPREEAPAETPTEPENGAGDTSEEPKE